MPWMSGLVNGLQNRLRRFESARHLTSNSQNLDKQRILRVFIFTDMKNCSHKWAETFDHSPEKKEATLSALSALENPSGAESVIQVSHPFFYNELNE